jgi:hypothetical protein
MTTVSTKQDALTLIASLAREFNLGQDEITATLQKNPVTEEKQASLLQKVLSYIGGAFVFCGICTYVGMVWADLDSLSRVIITLGSGFVAFLLGLFTLSDAKFIRASTPLFLIAAFLQPSGLFVFMDEYLPPSGDVAKASCFVFGFMLIQQSIAFLARQRTSLLFFSIFFFYAFMSAFMQYIGIESNLCALILGLSGLLVCWAVNRTEHKGVTPFFFFFSGLSVALTSYDYLDHTPFDILLFGIVGGMIYLSVLSNSRTLLTVSIISLLGYLAYFTNEYFKDIMGWPIALVVAGLIMIGASSFAVKLGKKMKIS